MQRIKNHVTDLERKHGHGKKIIVVGLEDEFFTEHDRSKLDERIAQLTKEALAQGYHEDDLIFVEMWEPDDE